MANSKNVAVTDDNTCEAPHGWQKVQTSFPPYWKAVENARFLAHVVGRDESNDNFVRFVLKALKPLTCYRGSGAEQEVKIRSGEFFTCSIYSNLKLDRYIGCDVFVRVIGKIEANTPSGFVWDFDVQISPESARLLKEQDAKNPLLSSP